MSSHLDDGVLSAYALEALAADERDVASIHLADCEMCQRQLDVWRELTATLATAAAPVAAPEGMRERVLARATAPALRAEPVTAPRRGIRRDLVWGVAVAASLVAAVGLSTRASKLDAEAARLRDALASAQVEAEERQLAIAERDSLLARLLGTDTRVTTLTSTEASASLRVYWDRGRREVIVAARRLPPAGAGRTYQLWGIANGGSPVGLGTFNTAGDGNATVVLAVGDVPAFTVTAVTLEPAGGSPGPTTPPIFVGPWPGEAIQ